jgi:hypothetical protein
MGQDFLVMTEEDEGDYLAGRVAVLRECRARPGRWMNCWRSLIKEDIWQALKNAAWLVQVEREANHDP